MMNRYRKILAVAVVASVMNAAFTSIAEARHHGPPPPPPPTAMYDYLHPRPYSDPECIKYGVDYTPMVDRKRELYAKAHNSTITEDEKEELERIISTLIKVGIYK